MKTCPQCHLAYPPESSFCFADGSSLESPKDPRIGTTVAGRYVIREALGVGGMAVVYRAHYKLVDRPCAIKILSKQFAADPTLRERLRRESRLARRLAHPNIIEIFDQGETADGMPFLIMELLQGKSLAALIEAGPIPFARALPIAIEMTRALARAHDFEVIHRDLKPENVFLLPGDRVKLLDFGIARFSPDARITNLGEIFGTPQYMAPERGSSIDAGPAADLYALGILLFEMLVGHLPFEANDPTGWLMKHMREPIPHLRQFLTDAPEALDLLICELMAKKPDDRPVDAQRVQTILIGLCGALNIPVPGEPDPGPPPVSRSLRTPNDAWQRRADLFDRMLTQGFGSAAPMDIARMLELLKSHLREITTLRASALEEQQILEGIENEGREGRLRLGKTMDALTFDVSQTRHEVRSLRAALLPLTAASKTFVPQVLAAHKELMQWEGRSGFHEPYRELAAAYRQLADLTDRWFETRHNEASANEEVIRKDLVIADADARIKELRTSLAALDKDIEERRSPCHKKLTDMGRRTEQLEAEILHFASRFCAPLRARPELGALFLELEQIKG
jgi:serine/threonine protein kinase